MNLYYIHKIEFKEYNLKILHFRQSCLNTRICYNENVLKNYITYGIETNGFKAELKVFGKMYSSIIFLNVLKNVYIFICRRRN